MTTDELKNRFADAERAHEKAQQDVREAFAQWREVFLASTTAGVPGQVKAIAKSQAERTLTLGEDGVVALRISAEELGTQVAAQEAAQLDFDQVRAESERMAQNGQGLSWQEVAHRDAVGRVIDSIRTFVEARGYRWAGIYDGVAWSHRRDKLDTAEATAFRAFSAAAQREEAAASVAAVAARVLRESQAADLWGD